MKLFVLSKEELALSEAEAERLHGVRGEREGHLLLLDVDEAAPGLAFTRSVHDLLFETTAGELDGTAVAFGWATAVDAPFAVRGQALVDEKNFAGHVWRGLEAAGRRPAVDLERPASLITLFPAKGGRVRVCKELWRNEERFSERRPHLRPRNHPTGLSPKLARAMVNLAGAPTAARELLDPFCGAGGILLEGSLVGRRMTGVDIDPRQIARAEENLARYGAAATLTVGDAIRCDALGRFDAIVTDLPLGKNARLREPERTFAAFFAAAARIADTMVVAVDAGFDLPACFRQYFREEGRFDWYLHKGMVKRLFLLGKA